MEFTASLGRWLGHGNIEFRMNIARAYADGSNVRLVIVKTDEIKRVEAGEDASTIKKDFFIREDLEGKVIGLEGEEYAFQFRKR